ncbi:MAG: hypothetical protein AAGD96_01665 [Chloroflexota bacterium]
MSVYHPDKRNAAWQSDESYDLHDEPIYDDFDYDDGFYDEYDFNEADIVDYDAYGYDEHELIPYSDDTLWMRMPLILGLVTMVIIGLFWIPLRGISTLRNLEIAGDTSTSAQAKPIDNDSNVAQATMPEPTPTLFPTQIPGTIVEVEITPAPLIAFDGNLNKQYVTSKISNNLELIRQIDFPARNYLDTHLELTTLGRPQTNSQIAWQQGQVRTINVMGDPIEVRLAAAGNHAYVWVDTRLSIADTSFNSVIRRIDNELYPAMTNMFGYENRPGIDNDNRFHIFHIARLNTKELGFFDSSDVYPTEIFAESNENEAIYINMDTMTVGEDVYYGTLVHELQHLIRWNIDKNETTWLDEGLSQLSEIYMGFNSFTVDDFIRNNDIQLNRWSYDDRDLYSHYGASALFTVYLWEQFGESFIQYLAASPYDGMTAVEDALKQAGHPVLEDVIRDWLISIYLNDPNVKEDQYGFSRYEFTPPSPHQVALVNDTPLNSTNRRQQFSAWYVDLPSNRNVTISFAGDSVQELFAEPPGGTENTVFYSPPRNRVRSSLSKRIDLRGASSPTLQFDAWYDMEEGFDYTYVLVSVDGGKTWGPLNFAAMKQGTYGPGFSGNSAGWQTHSASLHQFRGYEIIVRFLVLTDSAYPKHGFAVDNIQIAGEAPSLFEDHEDGWIADGFVRSGNLIPQLWTVTIVDKVANGDVLLTELDVKEWAEVKDVVYPVKGKATLVIAPISPFTTNEANFWLEVK